MMNLMPAGDDLANSTQAPDDYLRIGDVARRFDVTLRTLRFYEDKGLVQPLRDGSTRLYSRRDVARLKLVMFGRKVGFSLREVKQIMDLYDPAGSNLRQIKVLLDRSERQLTKLRKQRAALDEAIGELGSAMGAWRDQFARRQPLGNTSQ